MGEDGGPSGGRLLARAAGACLLAGLLVAGLLSPAAFGTAALVREATTVGEAPDVTFTAGRADETTVVTDRDGAPIAYLYDEFRLPVGSAGIADTMRAAIVAIEDERFYDHGGVDAQGIARALARNATSGSPLDGEGASTITMQYVKNYRVHALADTAAEQRAATEDTVLRKLTEAQLAAQVEQRLGKDEILTRYLDLVYYGRGAYGVEAAARVYFDTTADRLDIPQAALLAGLVRSPAGLDPVENADAALARRNTVIDAMRRVGSITPAQAAAAAATPLAVAGSASAPDQGCVGARPGTGFFCAEVERVLAAQGISPEQLRTGGYTVTTTLDARVSDAARDAAARVPTDGGVANVAAFLEPGTPQRPVRALVANRSYGPDAGAGQSVLPLVTAPLKGGGSVYKVFTAAAALEAGIVDPGTTLPVPDQYTARVFRDDDGGYTVRNAADYPDSLTLTQALAESPNTAFVELADRLGSVAPIVEKARALGMRESLQAPTAGGGTVGGDAVAQEQGSFTLGPTPTSPLELGNVAASLVDGGRWCEPTLVTEVRDRTGAPVALPPPDCAQALAPEIAAELRTALSEDSTEGTAASAASAAGWDRPLVAKTGTTQTSSSAAFLGGSERYAGAAMTFSDRAGNVPVCTDPVRTCSEGDLSGGSVPARTFFEAMVALDTVAT